MDVAKAVNIHDLRAMAKQRLPEIVFDFLEGGCDDEEGLLHNRDMLRRYRFVPRYCRDVSQRDLSAQIFGRTYAAPFGIAPTGQAGLFRTKAELHFAEAARRSNIPYVMSAVSTVRLEDAVAKAPENVWLQLYGLKDWAMVEDLVRRAKNAGVKTLVWTVDIPVPSNREGLRRNGFMAKMPLRIILEALKHPAWLAEYFANGRPVLANYLDYVPSGDPNLALGLVAAQSNLTWEHVSRVRDMWKGSFLVKGILHPGDAAEAVKLGADGVYISNHGGRQLDRAPSPFDMLPLIRKAIGDGPQIVIDSGIRRGSDVILARCLGANLALMGRAPNYGVASGGLKGVLHAIEIIRREADMVLGQLGCKNLQELGPHVLFDNLRGEFCA